MVCLARWRLCLTGLVKDQIVRMKTGWRLFPVALPMLYIGEGSLAMSACVWSVHSIKRISDLPLPQEVQTHFRSCSMLTKCARSSSNRSRKLAVRAMTLLTHHSTAWTSALALVYPFCNIHTYKETDFAIMIGFARRLPGDRAFGGRLTLASGTIQHARSETSRPVSV